MDLVSECSAIYRRALKEFEANKRDQFRFKYLEIAQKQILDMLRYVYPQRKAIDHTTLGQPITFADLMKLADENKE